MHICIFLSLFLSFFVFYFNCLGVIEGVIPSKYEGGELSPQMMRAATKSHEQAASKPQQSPKKRPADACMHHACSNIKTCIYTRGRYAFPWLHRGSLPSLFSLSSNAVASFVSRAKTTEAALCRSSSNFSIRFISSAAAALRGTPAGGSNTSTK